VVAVVLMRSPSESRVGGAGMLPLGLPAALLLFFSLASVACNGRSCEGAECCDGSGDCIVSCERDDCDLSCSQTSGTCGAVCGDSCDYTCEGATHCSSYSGEGSKIECHNVSSCASECGPNCDYVAYQVSSVAVTVGPDSEVSCTNLDRCEVACEGQCDVACGQVSTCRVECKAGTQTLNNVGGTETIRCQ
jgi:hypothetical protein